jgi:hypothetical protein
MVHVIDQGQGKFTHGRVHELLVKINVENPGKINVKREQFLTLLRSKYGYTNEKAIDELSRLLRQFTIINRSLGIHRRRKNFKHPDAEQQ